MKMIATVMAFGVMVAPALADKKVDEAVARAEEQLQKGKPDEALKTLQKVVSQQPGSGEAHTALARLQVRTGHIEEAAASAAKAVELSSSDARAEALTTLATLDLLRGSGRDAVGHADEAVKLKETAAALAVLARAQVRVQDPGALKTAERAVQAGGSSAAAHGALGEALLAQRRGDEAVAAFRKAVDLDPKFTQGRVGLAMALVAQGRAGEAVAEARKATEVDPQSGEAFAVLGTAILAENKDHWSDAIAQAQQGAFLNPRNPVVQLAVGRLFDAAGNLDQAQAAYRRALEADPQYAPARVALVEIQFRKGDLDAALAEAQKLTAAMPQSAEAQLQLGRILLRKADFVGAVEPLEKAAAAAPGLAEAHALLGTAYQYTGQSADALVAYRKAVELAPQNVQYRATLGLLLGLAKQYDAGIAELKKAIATPGYKDTAGFTNLGWIYRNMEPSRAEESVTAYKKALDLDPKNEQAALGLGWAYSYLRKWDDAIASFARAIELEAKTAGEAYNGTAWCYYFKNDLAQAKATLEKAKAAGRNVAHLQAQIERKEKGLAAAEDEAEKAIAQAQAEKEEGPDIATLGRTILKGNPTARRDAARQLPRFGRPAVQWLVYAAVNDKDFGVREEAINGLGSIGPSAREGCAQLRQIAGSNPYEQTIMEKAQMETWARYEDLRKAARGARSRIGCN